MTDVLQYCFGLPEVAYAAGTELITQGQGKGPLYILVSGTLAIERDGIEVARVDTPGAIVGEMSAFLNVPHTATAKAVSDVCVITIENPKPFIQSRPQIADHVATVLAKRLYDATAHLVDAMRHAGGDAVDVKTLSEALDSIMHGTGDASEPNSD